MGYMHKNKAGLSYWLHSRETKNGAKLFFFSKKSEGAIDLPPVYGIIENARTGLPMVKKK